MSALIPAPERLEKRSGTLRVADLRGVLAPAQAQAALERLGLALPHLDAEQTPCLRIEPADAAPEGYTLDIGPQGIRLRGTPGGWQWGVSTLLQLLEQGRGELEYLSIEDAPRFGYRGVMLDVSRHFMPLEFLKKLIDELARLKFNTFHWHLTDDQGWRLEIRRYPRLTAVGSRRAETVIGHAAQTPHTYDGTPHSGHYSQAEARELVAYAAARGITIVPEIDLPGHASAALAAYPELGVEGHSATVWCLWGISENVLAPREATFTFLEHVLEEVMEIFPGELIHIGGDEVCRDQWERSPEIREWAAREGLQVNEVQGYFTRRIGEFLRVRGRRLVGWDEILEGPVPEGAVVMSWRGFEGGIQAARAGHDVVMCPSSHVYLDHYQGDPASEPLAIGGHSPLEKVYGFDPLPVSLTPAEQRHILGGQANLWTEYMPGPEHVEYMAFPRLFAAAEALWSQPQCRDWSDFQRRLPPLLTAQGARGVRGRPLEHGFEK